MLEDIKLGRIASQETGRKSPASTESAESADVENTIKDISKVTRTQLLRLPKIALVLLAAMLAVAACDSRDPYDLPFVKGVPDKIDLKDPTLNHKLKCLRVAAFDRLNEFDRDPKLKKVCADIDVGKTPEDAVAKREELFKKEGLGEKREKWLRIAVKDEFTEEIKYIYRLETDPIDDLPPDVQAKIANAERLTAAEMAKVEAVEKYGRKYTAEQDKGHPDAKGIRDYAVGQDHQESINAIANPNN